MKIEITGPPEPGPTVTLRKSGTRVLVYCDCAGDVCPQGKTGSAPKCMVWIDRVHLSDLAIDNTKAMNRNTR